MQKEPMKIKWRGYKGSDNAFKEIFDYLNTLKGKEIYIRMDYEYNGDEVDIIFDKFNVTKINFNEIDDHNFELSFNADKKMQIDIYRLILAIKSIGDCGHSFPIKINGKTFYWDGDGNDYIEEIDDKKINHKSTINDFIKKFKKIEENKNLNYIISKTIRYEINEALKKIKYIYN